MSCADNLKRLLRPLGVYDLEGTVNAASLEVKGAALDGMEEILEELESGNVQTAAPAAAEDQISLMDMGSQSVLNKLRMTDVNVLSPIEALNLLAELKQDMNG